MPVLRLIVESKDARGRSIPAPNALRDLGPLLPIEIHPLDQHAQLAVQNKKPITPRKGTAILDTGAGRTAVDVKAAQAVGLPVIGTANLSSASHANLQVPVYAGKLVISGGAININVPAGLMGVNLDGQSGNTVALIGRDLLEAAVLIYDGGAGTVTLAIA